MFDSYCQAVIKILLHHCKYSVKCCCTTSFSSQKQVRLFSILMQNCTYKSTYFTELKSVTPKGDKHLCVCIFPSKNLPSLHLKMTDYHLSCYLGTTNATCITNGEKTSFLGGQTRTSFSLIHYYYAVIKRDFFSLYGM